MAHGLPGRVGLETEDREPVTADGEVGRRALSSDPEVLAQLEAINEKLERILLLLMQVVGGS